MKLFFFLIGRLFVIAFAMIIALITGSLFIGFGFATGMFPELALLSTDTSVIDPETDQAILAIATFIFGAITSFNLFSLSILPATIAISVTELFKWKSLTVQLIMGGGVALFIMFSALSLPVGQLPQNGTTIACLAAGFIATFFYWLISGRNAGEWLRALEE